MVKMEDAVKCKICGSYIRTNTGYDDIHCACGAIAVDGGNYYCRILGNQNNWEIVKMPAVKDDEND